MNFYAVPGSTVDVYSLLSFSQFHSSDFPEALSTSSHRKDKGKKNIWEMNKESVVGNKSFSRTCLQHLSLLSSFPPSLWAKRSTHYHCVPDKASQVSSDWWNRGAFTLKNSHRSSSHGSSKVASRSRVVTRSWVWWCRGHLRKVAFLLNSCIISQHIPHAHRVSKGVSIGNKLIF